MGKVLAAHHMVFAQLLHLSLAQQIGARIAHMRQREALAAQHQGRQRGQAVGRLAPPIDAVEPGVLRADDAVQRHRRLPGGWRAEEVIGQTRHRGLRGFAPPAARAHAIGHGRQHALVGAVIGHLHRGEVFIHRSTSGARDPSNVEFKRHGGDCDEENALRDMPETVRGLHWFDARAACLTPFGAAMWQATLRLGRAGRLRANGRIPVRPERGQRAEVSQGVQKKQRASKPRSS